MNFEKNNHMTRYIKKIKFYSIIKEIFNFIFKKSYDPIFIYKKIICIYLIKIFIKKINMVKNIYLTNLERKFELITLFRKKIFFYYFKIIKKNRQSYLKINE